MNKTSFAFAGLMSALLLGLGACGPKAKNASCPAACGTEECATPCQADTFPDGKPIDDWFRCYEPVSLASLGTPYPICRYGVKRDSTLLQTEAIQAVIDLCASQGGGVVVVPKGTFLTASLFFPQGTHLWIEKGGVLKGSDDIGDFPLVETRLEGQTIKYFAALINADGVDGFTMGGQGTINGNGLRYWKSFWKRRGYNPKCTNLEELRPRLVYIANSRNVRLDGLRLINSPFWTTHLYRCDSVRLTNLYIFAPVTPVKAPSSDALDLDVCSQILVKNCYMEVNDDAIALKGGKGPWADQDPNNGPNRDILIEDCSFGFSHAALTCGSESVLDHNVVVRRCHLDKCVKVLCLKMRPDTPQLYEYIRFEDITGNARHFLHIQPWTQFFDLKGRPDRPMSYARNISFHRVDLDCQHFYSVKGSQDYVLSDFLLEDVCLRAEDVQYDPSLIKDLVLRNLRLNP